MADSLPKYTFGNLSGSHLNQLGQFERILNEASNKGIIARTPSNKDETYDINSQKVRLQTIATRLWLLGYLPRKINKRKIDRKLDDIKEAVLRFQEDSNLEQDYWVGDKTWYALDELVSFESELSKEKWFENDKIKPEVENVFHRAIQLRLWSLGLYRNKPNYKFKLLNKQSLRNFKGILQIFLIRNAMFNADFNFETIKILFDQDYLTHCISSRASERKNSFMLFLSGRNPEIKKSLAQKFIVNCAKIELWLLGYDVRIDGKNDFEISRGSDLYSALCHYHEHFGNMSRQTAESFAERITPKLFTGIEEANSIKDTDRIDDASEEISKEFQSTIDIDNAWSYIKEKGTRLWDGLKRIWRWFKKIGRKIISFIKENVFRAFFRYVSKAYKIISAGILKVTKSIGVYLKGGFQLTNIHMIYSGDMDTTVFISNNISEVDAISGINNLMNHSKAFRVACKIVSFIFNIFKNISIAFIGWAKLLYSLVKGYSDLKILYHDFKDLAADMQ